MNNPYNQYLLASVVNVITDSIDITDYETLAGNLNQRGIKTKTGKSWSGNTLMRTLHRIPDSEKSLISPFEEGTLSLDGLCIHYRGSQQKYWQ